MKQEMQKFKTKLTIIKLHPHFETAKRFLLLGQEKVNVKKKCNQIITKIESNYINQNNQKCSVIPR